MISPNRLLSSVSHVAVFPLPYTHRDSEEYSVIIQSRHGQQARYIRYLMDQAKSRTFINGMVVPRNRDNLKIMNSSLYGYFRPDVYVNGHRYYDFEHDPYSATIKLDEPASTGSTVTIQGTFNPKRYYKNKNRHHDHLVKRSIH